MQTRCKRDHLINMRHGHMHIFDWYATHHLLFNFFHAPHSIIFSPCCSHTVTPMLPSRQLFPCQTHTHSASSSDRHTYPWTIILSLHIPIWIVQIMSVIATSYLAQITCLVQTIGAVNHYLDIFFHILSANHERVCGVMFIPSSSKTLCRLPCIT